MNKDQLVKKVAIRLNRHNKDVRSVVEELISTIVSELKHSRKVTIVGFGKFEKRRRAARRGRNPRTGKEIKIAATHTPAFTPGRAMRLAVKGK